MVVIHGGDTAGYRARYGREPLDFSASLNPCGMPPAVREAARRAVDEAHAYPDPQCRALAAALAATLGVPENFLSFGNGAADVIHRLALAVRPRRALVVAPGFAEYERGLAAAGCRAERHFLLRENSFDLREDVLGKITDGLDMLFLCQPNNPTGRLIAPELLRGILACCAAVGTLLVVDECFLHFVENPEQCSLRRFLREHKKLVIVDSFTKLYAMAGLRLGHAVSADVSLMETLSAVGQPWAVSTVAQAAGLAALAETGFVDTSLGRIRQAKTALLENLKNLPVTIIGHDANYIFFSTQKTDLDQTLADEGILIRNCSNFPGLSPGDFRVAVRLENENRILLNALKKALQ